MLCLVNSVSREVVLKSVSNKSTCLWLEQREGRRADFFLSNIIINFFKGKQLGTNLWLPAKVWILLEP